MAPRPRFTSMETSMSLAYMDTGIVVGLVNSDNKYCGLRRCSHAPTLAVSCDPHVAKPQVRTEQTGTYIYWPLPVKFVIIYEF